MREASSRSGGSTDDTRRDRQLTYVAHRVLGAVSEAADHRRRELRPSDAAELTERRRIDVAQLLDGQVDPCGEDIQRCRNACRIDLGAF